MKKGVLAFACVAVLVVGATFFLMGGTLALEDGLQANLLHVNQGLSGQGELSVGAVRSDEPGENDTVDKSESSPGLEYAEGSVLVGLSDGVTVSDLNSRLASLGCIATKEVSDDDVVFGYVALDLAEGVSVENAKALLAEEDLVAAVQPSYVYHLADDQVTAQSLIAGIITHVETVNDARVSEQWALEAVNAFEAWDVAKAEQAVTVAVIDNGCLTTHEDLKNNIVATYNAVTDDNNVTAQNGAHGTHVCGIVAAEANNGLGVAGVSYNAGLLPVNVFVGENAETTELLKAYGYILEHATEYNIKVINMSLGGTMDVDEATEDLLDEEDVALKAIVQKAYEKGILTVCSAGNDVGATLTFSRDDGSYTKKISGAYVNYPSDWLDCAIGVIASNSSGNRAPYSNYNMDGQATKDIMAPGGESGSNADRILSSVPSGYGYLFGTSMAAPCVSGIAALVFAANPDLTAGEVAAILCDTAQDMNVSANLKADSTFDLETGYGLVDAEAAVKAAKEKIHVPKSLSQATLELSASSYSYNGAARKPVPTVTLEGDTLVRGEDYTVEYSKNTNAGTATVMVTGVESRGFTGSKLETFTIKAAPLSGMTLSMTSCVFDGKVKSPGVTVTGVKGGKTGQTLKAGTDYVLTTPSGRKNAGSYTYKVTAKSANYTGTLSKNLTIKKASISSLTLSPKSFVYNGSAKKPTVVAKGSNGLTLKSGADYVVVYKNNKAVGKASVMVTGKGNYSGTKSAAFTIAKRANTMKVNVSTQKVKFLALKKARRSVSPISVKNARGSVTFTKTSGSKLLTVNKSSGKVTVAKGAKRGTYKANVKVSAAGNSTYKAFAKTVKVQVKVV